MSLHKTKKKMLDLLLDKVTKEFPDWQKSCIKNILVLWSSPLNRQTKFTDKNCKLEYEKA